MSQISDYSGSPAAPSGARAFARLDSEPTFRSTRPAAAPVDDATTTVTLDKIGDFLELDFGRLFVWLRAGLVVALVLAAIGAVAGGAYGTFSKPRYTVSTDVLIDPANLQVVADDLYSQPGQVDGQLLNAGSKLRVMTSGNVLARVVDDLDLIDDKEFFDPTPSFGLSSLFPSGAAGPAPDPKLVALGNLAARVSTLADEKSFVATLMVSSESTDKAIVISEAVVRAFQTELAEAEADGASRAAAALDNRLEQLKADVQVAEERVQSFRSSNNLAAAADGQLVSTQTMDALNAQVVTAQSRVIDAQTNYDSILAAGPDANPAGGAAVAALSALRDKAGALQQTLNAQSMTYGPRHPTIVSLNAELAAVNGQIANETQRVVDAAKTALDEANASLAVLTSKSATLTSNVFSDNQLQVQLRELERDATSKTAIYESFLSRARQITEQEQIDTTNVRVISTAVPPPARSWPPRTVVVIGMGAFAGLFLGMMLAVAMGILRDMRNKPARAA